MRKFDFKVLGMGFNNSDYPGAFTKPVEDIIKAHIAGKTLHLFKRDVMLKPKATLRLLREKKLGAKAMERRIKRCCADNPECSFQDECKVLYDAFVTSTDGDSRKEIYHQLRNLGVGSVEARANLSAKKVKELKNG